MNERLANDLIRYAELVEDGALISPEEMNCAALMRLAADALAQPEQEPVAKYCCHLCFNKSGQLFLDRMILCPECGNRRCPKATYHELPCTNSNEPNQAGSIYTTPPQRERVLFPTMLRKMWSGGEVQEWLDVNVNDNK